MKGLLVKDFLGIKSYMKLFLIVLVIGIVPVLVNKNGDFSGGFATGICAVLGGMMCFTSFAYDNSSTWDNYVLALPYSRKQIVLSKYIFSLLTLGTGVGLGIAVNLILAATWIANAGWQTWAFAGIIFCGVAFFISIVIPLIYRFGVEKSRLIVLLIFMAPFFITVGIANVQDAGISVHPEQVFGLLIKILPVIAAAALVLSYFISVRIYTKKEI